MKTPKLQDLSNEQLAEMFAELPREQGTAMEAEDTKRYNRLLDKLDAVKKEIRGRGDDARKALVPLLDASARDSIFPYQAAQTRFNAAVELKAVAPELARRLFNRWPLVDHANTAEWPE